MRADGVSVTCVHRDDAPTVLSFVLKSVSDRTEKQAISKQKIEKEEPVQKDTVQRLFIGEREVEPIKIHKYVSKAAYGDIWKICGSSRDDVLNVLLRIEKINILPSTKDNGDIFYIENNRLEKSAQIKLRGAGACISQGVKPTNNRPRIVWCVSKNYFVCQKVFSEHEGHTCPYNIYVNNTKMNIENVDLSEYLYVPDLIAEFSNVYPPQPQESPDAEPVAESVDDADETNADTPPVPAQPITQEQTSPKRRGRPRKNAATDAASQQVVAPVAPVTPVTPVTPPVAPVTQQPESEKIQTADHVGISADMQWVDLYSQHHSWQQQIDILNRERVDIMHRMSTETDTDSMLDMTERLRENLTRRRAYEQAIQRLRALNTELQAMKSHLDKIK